MGDSGAHPFAGILKDNLLRVGVVGELPLDDDTKAAQLKQDIRAMLAVNVNSFSIGSDPELGNKDSQLSVYYLFAISLPLRHCLRLVRSVTPPS
jgi:hypothetical protein